MEGMSAEDIEVKLYTTTDEHKIHIVIHESENIQEDDAGLQCELKVKRIEANGNEFRVMYERRPRARPRRTPEL